jgi:hypothetical protein
LQGSSGHVGGVALEGCAQGADLAALSSLRRKPSRLRAVPGCLDRGRARATPPCPQSPRPDPLSCWHARLSGFGSDIGRAAAWPAALNVPADQAGRCGQVAKGGAPLTGRGGVREPTQAARAATGRGVAAFSGLSGTAPGWICNARAGGARVN